MKGGTVQINWHDTKPVLTLDFHPLSGLLATGGADFDIKLWEINSDEEENRGPGASYKTSLSYHSSAVNALRFSPSGQQLASGADGGELVLWRLHSNDAGETWKFLKILLFHRKDVLDLQWSADGAFLLSGSVDNSCIIWDVNKGCVNQILDGHCHYVQGVAWDPLAKFSASLSSDRTCRIYVNKPSKTKGNDRMNYICQHVISKVEPQTADESKTSKNYLFHDETLPSFFRRLDWSPDGSFLLVPAGSYKHTPASELVNTAYMLSRNDLSRPALMLPGASKPVVAVRFCPVTFSLRGLKSCNFLLLTHSRFFWAYHVAVHIFYLYPDEKSIFDGCTADFFKLPYRLIFAVATLNSLYIYDTEGVEPIAVLAGLHYAAITDIAWSPTGKYLAMSSQDGYCTLLEFQNQELGSSIPFSEERKSMDDQHNIAHQMHWGSVIKAELDNSIAGAESEKAEADGKEDKQASAATLTTSTANKPPKRRITPMAVD